MHTSDANFDFNQCSIFKFNIQVQYSMFNIQVFGLEKGSNGQNHFSSGSHHHIN